jgi:hypothetical protein
MGEREPVDEGRIHEWLDGQLSPAEGARIEQLVADDPAWGEALAEARGLIAASRRIVRALDEVPGDVLPTERTPEFELRVAAAPVATSGMVAGADPTAAAAAGAAGAVRQPAAADAVRVISRAPSRRPRFMFRTWRNAAAILVVFVGSGAVLRLTRQTPSIGAPSAELAPTPVAELPAIASAPAPGGASALAPGSASAPAPGSAATGASAADAERKVGPAREMDAPPALSREADANSLRPAPTVALPPARVATASNQPTPPSQAVVALGAQSTAPANAIVSVPVQAPASPPGRLADSVAVVADAAPARDAARRTTQSAEAVAPAPPAGPRQEASEKASLATTSRARALRRDAVGATAGAGTEAGASAGAAAAEARSLSARGVGVRCVELALDRPSPGWPTAIALEPSRRSDGRWLAVARSADPAGRWLPGDWQMEGDSVIVLSALPGVGRARLWRDQLIGSDGASVPVRWVTCTRR